MSTSSSSLNAVLDDVFQRLARELDESSNALPAPQQTGPSARPQAVAAAGDPSGGGHIAASPPATRALKETDHLDRGDVERHQPFRIRRSVNGHRLPPLPESSFEVKLQRMRNNAAAETTTGGASSAVAAASGLVSRQLVRGGGGALLQSEHRALAPPAVKKERTKKPSADDGHTILDHPGSSHLVDTVSVSLREPSSALAPLPSHSHVHRLATSTTPPPPPIDVTPLLVHRRHCGLCSEKETLQHERQIALLVAVEKERRLEIEVARVAARESDLVEAWKALRAARDAYQHRLLRQQESEASFRRQCDFLAERLMKKYRLGRKDMVAQWEIEFDEIAALEKLSLRHLVQRCEVREKTAVRLAVEADQERAATLQKESEKLLHRHEMQRRGVEKEETFERSHVEREQFAVEQALALVFREARKKISDAEDRVHNMIARHTQKLLSIENEKERLKSEEVTRRELLVATEKRAYETMQQMEPDSRRRANAQLNSRLKRHAAERLAVEQAALDAAQTEADDEAAGRASLVALAQVEFERVAYRQNRRLLREQRRLFRQGVEQQAAADMKAEDDLAWVGVRHRFLTGLVFPCIEEEARRRQALASQKKAEKDFIWDLLRVRLFHNQAERRQRRDIEADEKVALDALQDVFRNVNALASFLWFETVERHKIFDDWAGATTVLETYRRDLFGAMRLAEQFPKARVDKLTTGPSGEIGVWVRNATPFWYWMSEDLSLLDGWSIRTNTLLSSTVVTDVKDLAVEVELLNAEAGDRLTYREPIRAGSSIDDAALPVVEKKKLVICFSGLCRDLLQSISFHNGTEYHRSKAYPRVLRVSIGSLTVNLHLFPQPPVCPLPTVSVSSRQCAPLVHLHLPSPQEFKTCRLILSLPEGVQPSSGHKLMLALPPEFTLHQKHGVMSQGKFLFRPKTVTDRQIEVEFDPKPQAITKTFLHCLVLQHSDDTGTIAPLPLEIFLTRKSDGSVVRIVQGLDVDGVLVDSPRVRMASSDLFYRLSFTPTSERVDKYFTVAAQHVLSSVNVAFPPKQPDVRGGQLRFELQSHDSLTTLGLHCSGGRHFAVENSGKRTVYFNLALPIPSHGAAGGSGQGSGGVRGSEDDEERERRLERSAPLPTDAEALRKLGFTAIATAHGIDSTSLVLQLRDDVSLSPAVVNFLLTSVTVTSKRTTLPKRGGDVSMKLQATLDVALLREPIEMTFRLLVQAPVLECAAKNGSFPYREGAGPKSLPSLTMRPLAGVPPMMQLSPEAMLSVQIVEGKEASDEIDVTDCEAREGDRVLLHVQNGIPVAEVRRVDASTVSFHISGAFYEAPWLRQQAEDAYSPISSALTTLTKFDVTVSHVNVLLRSLRYNCNSVDPQEDKKVILLTLDDGRSGRSSVCLDVAIETVDDPTDIIIDNPVVEYRQNSAKANIGCAILPTVRLEDIDSDNFHGGYIVVEHTSGPTEVGDHLYLLSPKQQELLLYRSQGRSSATHLQHLLSFSSEQQSCRALATVCDEQPVRILSLREQRYMLYNGESIGQISIKQTGSKEERTTYSIRMTFFAESKFVSFPTAEYCLRCFGFENRSAKMNTLERRFQITLNCTGLKSTCDTIEYVTVSGYVALLSNPAFAQSIRFEEGGKPKPILKQATTALHQPLFQRGYLKATILNPFEGDELHVDPASQELKVKDGRTVVAGKENIASIPNRKSLAVLHMDFLKMPNATLQTVVRSLVFSSNSRTLDPTQRVVEVEISTGNEVEQCSLTTYVDIQRRDEPIEFSSSPHAMPLVYMSGQPPGPVCSWTEVTLRKSTLALLSEVELQLPEKPKVGEALVLMTTADVDLVEDTDLQRVHFLLNGKLLAYTPKSKALQQDGEAWLFGKSASFTIAQDINVTEFKKLLDTFHYTNTCRADRGVKKPLALSVKQRGAVVAKTTLNLEVIAPILDFAGASSVVHGQGTSLVAPTARLQLASMLRYVEITVVAATGYDYSDSLCFKFPPNDPFGFVIEDEAVLVTNPTIVQSLQAQLAASALSGGESPMSPLAGVVTPPQPPATGMSGLNRTASRRSLMSPNLLSRDGKSVHVASIQTNTTSICISAEGVLSNSALQALLRSVAVSGEPRGDKEILIEVAVSSTCGQCAELVRVRM